MIEMEYYSAVWCGPCRQVGPIVEQLKSDGWVVTKIDVDKEPDKARTNGIQAIPTFLIYKDGAIVRRIVGARQKLALESELKLVQGVNGQ